MLPKTFNEIRQQKGGNRVVLTETITWDGEMTEGIVLVPIPMFLGSLLIAVENQGPALSVVLEHHIEGDDEEEVWAVAADSDGEKITLTIPAEKTTCLGPIANWPRFLGGRLKITAQAPPEEELTTKITIREV